MKTKIFAFILLVCMLFNFAFAVAPAQADIWGANFVAAVFKQLMEALWKIISDVLLSTLMTAANEIINTTLENILTAGSLHAMMFIADWQDYLMSRPLGVSKYFMNDFFLVTSRGRNVLGNYKACSPKDQNITPHLRLQQASEAVESVGIDDIIGQDNMNYYEYLIDRAKKTTIEIQLPEITLPEMTCDPFNLFADDNWKVYHSFISKPANNPYGFTLIAAETFDAKKNIEKTRAQTQAVANQGYQGKTDKTGRYTMTPGQAVKEIHMGIKDVGNKFAANADSVGRVIASAVTRIATVAIQRGIGQVQEKIQREINQNIEKYSADLDTARAKNSPRNLYDASY